MKVTAAVVTPAKAGGPGQFTNWIPAFAVIRHTRSVGVSLPQARAGCPRYRSASAPDFPCNREAMLFVQGLKVSARYARAALGWRLYL